MNLRTVKSSLAISALVFSFIVAVPAVVSAQNERMQEAKTAAEERREAAATQVSDRKEASEAKRTEAKAAVCERRQKNLTRIMTRIADRGDKQIALFSTIAERTQAFYETKGKTLANYDELVADVAAKKEAAQTAVTKIADDAESLDCSAEDPKAAVTLFKESLKAEIAALKEYKTSVKNLIVGVKSVQSTTAPDTTETEEQ